VAGITYLRSVYTNISNLDSIKCLNNLEYLELAGNQIEDLGPLADLPKLQLLDLDYNPLSDSLSPELDDHLGFCHTERGPESPM